MRKRAERNRRTHKNKNKKRSKINNIVGHKMIYMYYKYAKINTVSKKIKSLIGNINVN